MNFLWDFSDGSTYKAYRLIADVNELVTRTHVFSHSGKFPVNVTVFNSLSSVSSMLPYNLVAQHPVENIALTSNSPARLNPGIVIFQLSLKSNTTAPTDAVCRWDFNDGSSSYGSENLMISSNKSQERSHTFRREGIFSPTVNISNHVSNLVLSVEVEVQKVVDVSITVGRVKNGVMTDGFGDAKDYFPSKVAVHFNVTSQPKDLRYIWNFSDGSPLSILTTPSTSHTYNLRGEYKIEVTVDNTLAKLTATKDVTIQRAVGEISITSSYPNYKGDPTNFTIDIADQGTDSCFVLDFRDSYKAFFGGERCRPRLLSPQFIFRKIDADQTQVDVTHVYSLTDSFAVTLTASNIVSTKIASTLVNVTGSPCDVPSVTIVGDSSNDPPTQVKKSEKLFLKRQVTYRCPVASSLVFTWGVYEVSFSDPHNESKPLDLSESLVRMVKLPATELDLEAADLTIKERKLPFGLIKFSLKLGFIGKDRDLSDIYGTHTVWIEVKRSELEAVIRGSVKRSVGYQLPLTLDGTDSKDPDVLGDMTGITFKWMCKKKGEEFPKGESVPSSDGGCWENGTFVFGGNNQKVVVYTGDFYQKAYYDLRLTISKDTRKDNFDQSVQVLVGQPPTMVIENVFNKLVKRNPFQRLIVEGRCIDCKMDDRLEYKWKLSLLEESSDGTPVDETSDDSWKELTDWADKTATGLSSSSLVIESGFLIAGRKYRLQLNAWRPGGEPGGYVIEELFMNVAPAKGSCQLPMSQGYALETEFVVKCQGWEDDDKPLSYLIELQNGDEIIPMAAGLEPEMSAAFPLGKAENNYTIQVNVKVMDAYMLSTETFFTVRVLEPISIDYDKVMGDMTGSADEEGGDQKAVQLATAASSVLNAKAGKSSGNDSSGASERAAFRGKVAGALSNLPVKDFDGVAMKGEALNSLTQATGEVDEDAQNATVKALDEMGDFLSGSDSARDVENVAKSLGSAIGNVVGASIDSYQKAANGTSSGDPSKSKNNTKNALGVVDKVSGALLKQLAAGDKPKAISSPNLDMSVGRKTLDGIGGEDDDDDEDEGTGGVKLPNPLALFGGANASVDEGATSAIGSTVSADMEYALIHDVDIAIEQVTVTSDKRFIRVYESVSVGVTVKEGTRMNFLWDFSDGNTYSAYRQIADVNELVTSTHAFSHSGKFPVNVTVFNSLSSVSSMLPYNLVAQHPVENIAMTSNSPARLNPGIVIFQLSLKSNTTAPTDAVCRWDFNDGSSPSGNENLIISSINSQERSHTFRREGIFSPTVNISNQVSNLVLSVKVEVQKVVDVSITVGRIKNELMTDGFGDAKDYFPSNVAVHFNVTSQPKDLRYIWNFSDGSPLSITTTPSTSHTYNLRGEYKIEVTVDNILAKLTATKDVTIQRVVGEISVTSSYPNYKGDPTNFTIDIADQGTDSCFVLDFRDSYKAFFGGERCRPRLLSPQFSFRKIDAAQTQVDVTHVYSLMDSFLVTLTASNVVSTKVASTLVNVTGSPCDVPSVKIAGDSSNDPPTEVKKSEKLFLKRQVTYRCPVASRLVFTWGVYEVSFADPHDESKPLDLSESLVRMVKLPATELDLEAADLTIKERKLPFGLIKFSLKLGFIGKDRDLSDIFGTHTVWIEVKRSELEAVIRGSVKRSVGYQLPLTLDGTDSKDPDVLGDMTGITFMWMCKKKGEEFPKEGSVPSSDGGCWENGTFVFGGNNQKVVVYTGDFYQKAYYGFRLTISKDTRMDNFDQSVQVLVGQPPTMVIENVFNKLVKRNPFQRLIVEGRCIDCKMDDRLEYKWKLSLLEESSDGTPIDETSDDSWKEMIDWADKTATGLSSSSLVIESGFLIAGRKYRLQLNAWRPGGEPGGYVIEELFMNVAPAKGSCQLPISQGYALETEFVVKCEGWEDDDKPLSYLIELQNGDEIIPMAAGLEPEMSAAFPLGKAENNYTIQVNVKVMDAYKLSTETFFTVRVLEPVSIDYDKVMGDMTGSADEEGGDQKAVQLATAASSVLNAKAGKSSGNDSSAASERAAFRGKVAGALSNLPVKDFDGVAMKGEALNSLTQATGEVDEDAQNATVKALDEMGDFLSGSDSARDVENVAKSLGSAIGNVVGASIDSYQKAANGTSSGDPSKSKNNTKNALGVVDKVSGALLKQLAAGDKPKAISSPNLDMSVGRKTLDGIGGEDDEDDDDEGTGGVKLPNPLALFGGANASVEEGATSAIGSTVSADMGQRSHNSLHT
ncbi:PREDICTED: uncharacterized protein LOC107341314 [Acropora digitifera]|uniref:uncharacterized protein LOC107341314 n=1 Tax=Acropora digitifera TaxID=70779 RepID=UPI00077A0392|nr:PREDICTED: uncharacterized protein LOC107341314 [Acropora digitifera]